MEILPDIICGVIDSAGEPVRRIYKTRMMVWTVAKNQD